MSDPTAATGLPSSPPSSRHHRRIANYLLDKSLQLRYVVLVTVLSATIAGALGTMIYNQRRSASESIERDLQALTSADASHRDFQDQVASGLLSDDQALVYRMAAVGFGLVIILSAYLVIMTHKVAGPLYKVSMYFDRMAQGRLGVVTPLRRGDMLQDFFTDFKDMHEALRGRAIVDADAMASAATALRTVARDGDHAALTDALDALDAHVRERRKQLA